MKTPTSSTLTLVSAPAPDLLNLWHNRATMNPNTPYEQPEPNERPAPGEEQPVPAEQPKRRRLIQPVFSTARDRGYRAAASLLTATAVCISLGTSAQTPPTPTTNPTGQQPTTPQAVTPQRGWVMFDDKVGNDMRMPPEQLDKLRSVDERYMGEYRALGNDPAMNPRYQRLTDQRNAEIRKVLDPATYDTWITTYQPVPNTIQEQRSGGISTPPPPTP